MIIKNREKKKEKWVINIAREELASSASYAFSFLLLIILLLFIIASVKIFNTLK